MGTKCRCPRCGESLVIEEDVEKHTIILFEQYMEKEEAKEKEKKEREELTKKKHELNVAIGEFEGS